MPEVTQRKPETEFAAFLAIDWADQKHAWALQTYLLGHAAYGSSDAKGSPSGPIIDKPTVLAEDFAFASVLYNRIGGWGDSIAAVVQNHKGQYNVNEAKLKSALNSADGSSECQNLQYALIALQSVLQYGSTLSSDYKYWKAIDQGKTGFHRFRSGDIYIANTEIGRAHV